MLVVCLFSKSNQITFIVTSPQHKCLGEWNSYERAPDSAETKTIYIWTDSERRTFCRRTLFVSVSPFLLYPE